MTPSEELFYGFDLMGVDPGELTAALAKAGVGAARQPARLANALGGLALEQMSVGLNVARRALGAEGEPLVKPEPRDRRFSDRAWSENPFLSGLLESYLVTSRWAARMVESAELPADTAKKARFALGMLVDAASPSN